MATEDQFAQVVAEPSQALSSMLDSELIRPGGSDEAQAEGRAFEEKVLRSLE